MVAHYRSLFAAIHERPGMYGLDGSYRTACKYLLGFELGNPAPFTGFREWLVVRVNGHDNVHWDSHVLLEAFPDDPDLRARIGRGADAGDEAERKAFDALFSLLDEFFVIRQERDGLAWIFERYIAWLDERPGGETHARFRARLAKPS